MLHSFWKQDPAKSSEDRDEDAESLLRDTEGFYQRKTSTPWYSLRIAIISLSYIIIAALGVWLGSHWRLNPAAFCAQLTARYSPVIEGLGLSYKTVQYNGSFFNLNEFRQDAGPQVDAAWQSLGVDYRAIAVPVDQAVRSGLASDQVKINPKYGGGFPANVEGLHHLHCLNLLRKSLYYNFDYYHALGEGAFMNNDVVLKNHITHCLDILRQQLMCTVDVGMLGQVWWDPNAPKSFVDFNTKHMCRNFEEIRKWAKERQLPEKVPKDFLDPPKQGDLIYDSIP